MRLRVQTVPCLLPLALGALLTLSQTPNATWVEGEDFTKASVKPNVAGWGRQKFLSGEKWAQISSDDKSAGPATISYAFETSAGGTHNVWIRLGYEFARSPFRWRLDEGAWNECKPTDLTSDLMPIDTWCEVAWLKLGNQNLPPGSHALEFEVSQRKDDKGQNNGLLFACDAIVVTPDEFGPNGPNKPGSNPVTESDRKAAEQVFHLPKQDGPKRVEIGLDGLWQIARDDEKLPGPVAEPIAKLPENPYWSAIPVPSDRNVSRPDLMFAHRFWYRTRFSVPDPVGRRSFFIKFPQNCLNTTVYVNGQLCGFEKNPFVGFQIDVTKAVKQGENELMVGIRDAWYGYSANPNDPMKLRRKFNLPLDFAKQGFQDLAYPVWGSFYSGILETPTLVVAGRTYAQDVFVQPSVTDKTLVAEVTVKGEGGSVRCEVVDPKTGSVTTKFGPVQAGTNNKVRLAGNWANPELWWPDSPRMYTLRTIVAVDGKDVDVQETPFGFREWTIQGKDWYLNGIRWKGWAELVSGDSADQWLANYRKADQRFMRLSGVAQNGGYRWKGMSTDDTLNWFDRNGVVVRRSGILDGEAIGYMAVENDPDLKKLYNSEIKIELMRNWLDQMVAQVKWERNHPSIHVWSIENEWLYINCINLYSNHMDEFEREVLKVGQAVSQADPTRAWMVDGGGAAKDNSYPVHGDHYVFTNDPGTYPGLAYQAFAKGGGRGRWEWDGKRPRYLAEDFYAGGINPADYAWIAGEEAFGGKTAAHRGIMLVQRMLTEGYRWGEHNAYWHFWVGSDGSQFGKWTANAERAVFCRQYDWTFGSGQTVSRTLKVFNDSRHADRIDLEAVWGVGSQSVDTLRQSFTIAPGNSVELPVQVKMPAVQKRTEGRWNLSLKVNGQTVFQDTKPLSVLPSSSALDAKLKAAFPAGSLAVFDPGKRVLSWIKAHGVAATELASLTQIPANTKLLVIGPDALKPDESTKPTLAAAALDGLKVLVLDQSNPLRFQALPVPIESTDRKGAFAFIENPNHPVFDGLKDSDLTAWPADETTFRKAYRKPETGARSLVQGHERLAYTPLVEVPVGQGLMVLNQLNIGPNLGLSATASRLLTNLLLYTGTYRLQSVPVTAFTGANLQLEVALGAIGVQHTKAASALQAIEPPSKRIAVVSGDRATLESLANQPSKLAAFFKAGGRLVVNGLTQDGIAAYNKIVGVPHMARPFRREKTGWASPRDPLATGIGTGDIVMMSSERLFEWTSDMWIADDVFGACVDVDDVAPFAQLPGGYENIVNGMVSSDGWKYIFSFGLPQMKPEVEFRFPKPMEFTRMEWIGNGFYHLVNKIELTFDGKDKVVYDVEPNTEPQTLDIRPSRRAQNVLVRIVEWEEVPAANGNVVGIDNIRFWVQRDPAVWSKVHPIDRSGALVRYDIDNGGVVLANLLFKPTESVPENAGKKRNILAGLLRNLGASFAGSRPVIVGAKGNVFVPIDISQKANQFRNQRGWFGDPNRTFADLPTGRQLMAGVPFDVYEFKTSPVPNCIMLGGPGVPNNLPEEVTGIPVNRKAAALFFLQTAKVDRPVQDWERGNRKEFVVAKVVVRYSDGQTAEIPWALERNVGHFVQKQPASLPTAALAWSKPYPNSDDSAVAYVVQWNNPRPDATIASFDLIYGPERRAVPVILAVTAVD